MTNEDVVDWIVILCEDVTNCVKIRDKEELKRRRQEIE